MCRGPLHNSIRQNVCFLFSFKSLILLRSKLTPPLLFRKGLPRQKKFLVSTLTGVCKIFFIVTVWISSSLYLLILIDCTDTVMNICIKTMVEDDDKEVVAQACTNVADIVRDYGYATLEPCKCRII